MYSKLCTHGATQEGGKGKITAKCVKSLKKGKKDDFIIPPNPILLFYTHTHIRHMRTNQLVPGRHQSNNFQGKNKPKGTKKKLNNKIAHTQRLIAIQL
jgi:hypothetical protein